VPFALRSTGRAGPHRTGTGLTANTPDRLKNMRDELTHVLEQFGERLLRSAQDELARAAERSVGQAIDLMLAPDYAITVC
jgi:hypothetical protein